MENELIFKYHDLKEDQIEVLEAIERIGDIPVRFIGDAEKCPEGIKFHPLLVDRLNANDVKDLVFRRCADTSGYYFFIDPDHSTSIEDRLVNGHIFIFRKDTPISVETLSLICYYLEKNIALIVIHYMEEEDYRNHWKVIYDRLIESIRSSNVRNILRGDINKLTSHIYVLAIEKFNSKEILNILEDNLKHYICYTKKQTYPIIEDEYVRQSGKSEMVLDSLTHLMPMYKEGKEKEIKKFKGKRTYTSNGFKNRRDI